MTERCSAFSKMNSQSNITDDDGEVDGTMTTKLIRLSDSQDSAVNEDDVMKAINHLQMLRVKKRDTMMSTSSGGHDSTGTTIYKLN